MGSEVLRVKPLHFPLLLDENIHPAVAAELSRRGADAKTVSEANLLGAPDSEVLEAAINEGRVVVTHDSDFGTLAVRTGHRLIGIVYLRPGHINPQVVVGMLDAVDEMEVAPTPPFIVVAVRKTTGVRVRLRELQAVSLG